LGIPTVKDRLIQQAILQVLTPTFDPGFSEHSYGFRPKRNAHQAIRRAQDYIKKGYNHVVDIDIEKFFDKVNHDKLMARIARKIEDKRMLKVIRRYLKAGVMINGRCVITEEGTPQGGPLSPLLANIVLHELDEELGKRKHRFVRYADDCNIYVKSKRAAQRVLANITKYLEEKLKLKINKEKSAADRPWKRKILGYTFMPGRESRLRLAPQTIKRLKDKIRELTRRSNWPMKERIRGLNEYLRGWLTYFQLVDTRSVIKDLDEWIRRRLRACLLKQWKKPRTKKRKLVNLGITEEWAKLVSGSRKGCWRLSLTHQMHKALGLAYWQEQELIGLVTRYDELRYAL
jgi:group II intron reverse transcriptase/maturase